MTGIAFPNNKKLIFQEFAPLLREHGFEPMPEFNQFRRNTKQGFHALFLTITPYQNELAIDVNLGCRLNIVEDTMYQFTTGLKGFSPHATTAIVNPNKINDSRSYRFFVNDLSSFTAFEQNLRDFLKEEGFQFFDFLDDRIFLDTHFNAKPEKPCILQYNQINRAFRGITIAKLAHNCSYDDLLKTYLRDLKDKNTPKQIVDKFALLGNYLQLNSFS